MSPDKAPAVVQTPGGLSVSYGGRLLYSARDPRRTPERAAAACDPGPERLHLVASPLLWYGIGELAARAGPGSRILCVEADPALAELSLRSAPPGLLDGGMVSFIATDSPERVLRAARELGRFRACAPISLSGGESLNAPLYRRMADLLSEDIGTSWRNRASLVAMGGLWARNVLANAAALPEIGPGPMPRFPGPAAVCGAGPSLDEAMPFLRRNRGRLAVIACDTALGSLLGSGIEPDLVVCLEAQAHNLADFTCAGSRPLALAADLSSHPATFRAARGPRHLTAVSITDSPFLSRALAFAAEACPGCVPMPPLGSVGVHAAALARGLAAGPVVALGLDFSFEAGKTHARGTPALASGQAKLDRLTRWEAQFAASFRPRTREAPCPPLPGGRRLLSDPTLLSYAALLAQACAGPGAAVVDARGRGPSFGAERMSLEAVEAALGGWAADAALKAQAEAPAADARREPAFDSARARAARDRFLEGEAERLEALYGIMKGRSGAGRSELAQLVSDCDYLYWGFPDADRAAGMPQDFLNRLLPEVERWSSRIAGLRSGA